MTKRVRVGAIAAALALTGLAPLADAQRDRATWKPPGGAPGAKPVDPGRPPPPPGTGQRPPPGHAGHRPGPWPGYWPGYAWPGYGPGWAWSWGYGAAFPWWGYGAWLPYGWPRSGSQTIYVNPEPMPPYGGTGVIPPFVVPGQWYCPSSGAYYPQVNSCQQPWREVAPVDPMPPPQPPAPDPVPDSEPPAVPAR